MRIFVAEKKNTILDEIHSIQYYKPKGRKPYSSEVLRFALLQRYTSKQAYIQLQEKIPLPSFPAGTGRPRTSIGRTKFVRSSTSKKDQFRHP